MCFCSFLFFFFVLFYHFFCFFFFQAEDGIRDRDVTGVQTCALPIYYRPENHEDKAIPALVLSRGRRTRALARAGQVQPTLPHIEVYHLSSEEASTFRIDRKSVV